MFSKLLWLCACSFNLQVYACNCLVYRIEFLMCMSMVLVVPAISYMYAKLNASFLFALCECLIYWYIHVVSVRCVGVCCPCCVVTVGNLIVLFSALQLHAKRSSTPDHTHHRLSWCPYVPQEEGDEEDGWMLAVSHGCEVRGDRQESNSPCRIETENMHMLLLHMHSHTYRSKTCLSFVLLHVICAIRAILGTVHVQ